MALYRDRREPGEQLAEALEDLRGKRDLLVLALPRGGVPVAEPVARRLGAPLDVTQAVEPLERMPLWEAGESAETYPTGL
jgi:predicted phosphoribosyltransferase